MFHSTQSLKISKADYFAKNDPMVHHLCPINYSVRTTCMVSVLESDSILYFELVLIVNAQPGDYVCIYCQSLHLGIYTLHLWLVQILVLLCN